jgi:hypothetical protein
MEKYNIFYYFNKQFHLPTNVLHTPARKSFMTCICSFCDRARSPSDELPLPFRQEL